MGVRTMIESIDLRGLEIIALDEIIGKIRGCVSDLQQTQNRIQRVQASLGRWR
jgi:hypothetical protein